MSVMDLMGVILYWNIYVYSECHSTPSPLRIINLAPDKQMDYEANENDWPCQAPHSLHGSTHFNMIYSLKRIQKHLNLLTIWT